MSGTTQQATQPSYSLNLDWLAQDIVKYIKDVLDDYIKSVHDSLVSGNQELAKNLDGIIKRAGYSVNVDDEPIKTYMNRFKEISTIVGYLSAIASMITMLEGQLRNVSGQERRMIEEERGKLLSIFKHLLAAYHNVDVDTLSDQEVLLELRHYAALASGLAEYLKEMLKNDYLRKGGSLYKIEDIYRLGDAIHSLYVKLISDSILLLYDRLLRDGYIGPKLIAKVIASIIKQNPDMNYNFSSEAFKNLYSKYVTPPSTTQPTQGQQIPQQAPVSQQPKGQPQQGPTGQQQPSQTQGQPSQVPSSQQSQQPQASQTQQTQSTQQPQVQQVPQQQSQSGQQPQRPQSPQTQQTPQQVPVSQQAQPQQGQHQGP